MAIPFRTATSSSLELLDGLQDSLNVADLGDPKVAKVPSCQREELSSSDIVLGERIRILTELDAFEPILYFLHSP